MKIIITEHHYKLIAEDSIQLYHGSPHSFDKFSSKKSLSGEGVNARGWGLYFTSEESIARYYRNCLTNTTKDTLYGKPFMVYFNKLKNSNEDDYIKNEKLAFLEDLNHTRDIEESLERIDDDEIIEWARNEIRPNYKPSGSIYCVIIHKDKKPWEYTYIEWEGLVEGDVGERILNVAKRYIKGSNYEGLKDILGLSEGYEGDYPYGYSLYNYLSVVLGSEKKASLFLLKCGIDGIKYRANEQQEYDAENINYVVFDEKSITIKDKY